MLQSRFRHIRLAVRILLVCAVGGLFLWILDQNIPFAGQRRIEYTFDTLSGEVSQLRPLTRATRFADIQGVKSYQTVFEDPVYFDIKTPVAYDRAAFEVTLQNHASRPISMGLKMNGAWNFMLHPLQTAPSAEWKVERAVFDLRRASRTNSKYTFLFSIPGLTIDARDTEFVRMAKMSIVLERETLADTVYRKFVKRNE